MESFFSITIVAIALSMDSFAVSLSNGLSIKKLSAFKILIIASFFAFFQAFMPLLGWLSGMGIENYIESIDHWIAFILLSIIGGKMIYEGITSQNEHQTKSFKYSSIVSESIATSIDAFVVGISFSILDIAIVNSVIIIGIVTFIFSILGLYLGKYLGKKIGKPAEILGGIILIGIGSKILIEHLFFT